MRSNILIAMLLSATLASSANANDSRPLYNSMKSLVGDWKLSPADKQQGKATRHKLVAPLVGTEVVGMNFRLIGKESTIQESLLPGTKKEMVTMYHCINTMCQEVRATHYCVKQNQPEMLLDPSSTDKKYIFNCDMSTDLCQSGQDHVHKVTHDISSDGNHLKTTYTSWKKGKYLKDSTYHFDRK